MSTYYFLAGMFTGAIFMGIPCLFDISQKRKALRTPEDSQEKSPRYPMPCGTRLELGATGYWIELVSKPGENPYLGYDPEGDVITRGLYLDQMKAHLERHAAFRDEFAPRVGGANPWTAP